MDKLNTPYYIFGAGGHASSIYSILKCDFKIDEDNIKFVVQNSSIDNHHIGEKRFYEEKMFIDSRVYIGIGSVGNTEIRKAVCDKLNSYGIVISNIFANSAVSYAQFKNPIPQGLFVGANSIINANVSLGDMVIVNSASVIEHDCIIGDYVHISPNATLCGNVQVGDNTHIGAGSTVIQGVKIGSNTIIGAGSVVVSDMPNGVIAYGNPCRIMKKYE